MRSVVDRNVVMRRVPVLLALRRPYKPVGLYFCVGVKPYLLGRINCHSIYMCGSEKHLVVRENEGSLSGAIRATSSA